MIKEGVPEIPTSCPQYERPGREVVMMNGKIGKVEVAAGEGEKELFTFGVNGCTVTAVFIEDANGTREGMLAHRDPAVTSQTMADLGALLESIEGSAIVKARIFVRGEYEQSEDGKWHMVAAKDAQRELRGIELAIKSHLANAEVKSVTYSMMLKSEEIRELRFVIKPKKHPGEKENDDSPVVHWWGIPERL